VPDSSRPTTSRFFQISKSYITFDNSAKRVANHAGGKNLHIIFAYLTSKIFEIVMIDESSSGKTGKDVFRQDDDGWINPRFFLTSMDWKVNTLTEKIITDIFNSFVQDKVMKSRSSKGYEFYFIKDLEFPSDDQVDDARESNKYLMNIIDDLTKFLPRTLEGGNPCHDRNTMLYFPMWEAFYVDPIHEAYKDEMVFQADELISNFELTGKLSLVQIGTGTGFGSLEIMDLMIDKLHSVEIGLTYIEEKSHLLNKAQEQLSHHLSENMKRYNEKYITVKPNFSTQSIYELDDVEPRSANIVFAFQVLQFVKESKLKPFFLQISRMLRPDGIFVLIQPTSYSKEFPYPLTLLYHSVTDFYGFPTVDQVKDAAKLSFDKIQVSAMDTLWIMRLPKNIS
jgi:cyclopropane fatty-acyl-phospholipid synthase-like methyltransferase